jgi:hypothetical protein
MKLSSEEIVPAESGAEAPFVLSGGEDVPDVDRIGIIGVHEVELVPFAEPREQGVVAFDSDGVPSHVRDFVSTVFEGEATGRPWDEAETGDVALLGAIEDDLSADADPEDRSTPGHDLAKGDVEPRANEVVHGGLGGADPREDHPIGAADEVGIRGEGRGDVHGRASSLDAAEVPSVVIDDGDQGMTQLMRGPREEPQMLHISPVSTLFV